MEGRQARENSAYDKVATQKSYIREVFKYMFEIFPLKILQRNTWGSGTPIQAWVALRPHTQWSVLAMTNPRPSFTASSIACGS